MKKLSCIILAIVLLNLSAFSVVFASDNQTEVPYVKIVINGKMESFQKTTIISNNRTLLPFREVLNKLGVPNDEQSIKWDDADKSIKVKAKIGKIDADISMKIGNNSTKVNGKDETVDVAPIIYKDSTYIPVRYVAQALSKKVVWDDATKSVYIDDEDSFNAVKDILTKSVKASADIKKFKAVVKSEVGFGDSDPNSANQPIRLKGNKDIELDFTNDIFRTLMYPSVEIAEQDKPKTEIFASQGVVYTHNNTTNEWFKNPNNKVMLKNYANIGKMLAIPATDIICAGLNLDNNAPEGKYLLKGDVYISEILNSLIGSDSFLKVVDKVVMKYSVEILIDKKTNLVESQSYTLNVTGNGKTSFASGSIAFSAYNGDFTIKLPQEALNAKEFEQKATTTTPNK